jgi:hypothetical protein
LKDTILKKQHDRIAPLVIGPHDEFSPKRSDFFAVTRGKEQFFQGKEFLAVRTFLRNPEDRESPD